MGLAIRQIKKKKTWVCKHALMVVTGIGSSRLKLYIIYAWETWRCLFLHHQTVKAVSNIPCFQDYKALLKKLKQNFDSWTLNNGAPYVWPERKKKGSVQTCYYLSSTQISESYATKVAPCLHSLFVDLHSIHFSLREQSTDSPGRDIYGRPQVIQHCLRASLFQQPHLLSQCGELVGCYPVLDLACSN